jgi:hypothetical protein
MPDPRNHFLNAYARSCLVLPRDVRTRPLDPTIAIRSQMLATLMAALEISPARTGGTETRAQTLTGRLTRLEADGAAQMNVAGKLVSLAIKPEALDRARAALGALVTLKLEPSAENGAIQARFVDNAASGRFSSPLPAGEAVRSERLAITPPEIRQSPQMASQPPGASPAGRLALTQAVTQASAGQLDLGAVFAGAARLAEPGMLAALPPSLRQTVAQLLDLRLDEAALSQPAARAGEALSQAVSRSGLTHEARLATGLPQQAMLAGGDLKSALMQLLGVANALKAPPADNVPPPRQMLPAVDPVQPASPPPHRDAAPRGQPPADLPVNAAGTDLHEVAATLARQAEGALDRMRLLQAASLPDVKPQGETAAGPQQRWHVELPMALPDGRTQVLPLRIEREASRRAAIQGTAPGWRVQFALDGEPMGAIQAIVTWRMRQIGVSIFAERPATREALRAEASHLRRNLDRAGVEGVEIDITAGHAPEPKPATGRLLDQVT